MKRFLGIIAALLLIVGSWGFAGAAQANEMGGVYRTFFYAISPYQYS